MQTGYLQDNDGPDGEQFNVIYRKSAEAFTQWLGYYLRPQNTWPPASDSAWCIGCVASAGSGAASTITTGSILHYDPSYYTSTQDGVETLPDWMLIPVPAAQSVAHSENSSGSTRVDLVCIDAAPSVGPNTTVAQRGGGTLSRPITYGAIPVLKVVEGSPGAGAPSLPSGYVQLASVSVPTGTTSANWSSNVTYTDSRTLLSNNVSRYEAFQGYENGSNRVVMFEYPENSGDALQWDGDNTGRWPRFVRGITSGGEQNGAYYPLASFNGRTYWRQINFAAFVDWSATGVDGNVTPPSYYRIVQTASGTKSGIFVCPIEYDARYVGVQDFKIAINMVAQFDGTVNTFDADLIRMSSTGVATDIATIDLSGLSTGAQVVQASVSGTVSSTDSLAEGETLQIRITVGTTGGTGVGELHIYGAQVEFKEGKA